MSDGEWILTGGEIKKYGPPRPVTLKDGSEAVVRTITTRPLLGKAMLGLKSQDALPSAASHCQCGHLWGNHRSPQTSDNPDPGHRGCKERGCSCRDFVSADGS